MDGRTFGWTGENVPVIGQGTWEIEDSRQQEDIAVEALRTGMELGMTHIDTAEMYGSGRAEELVGRAIAGRRTGIFLATKVLPSNASYEGTLRACERSLKRLGVEQIDLYMLHWESRYPIGETMRAMERLIEEKSIRYTGVSNFDVAALQDAQAAMPHHRLACNQVLYHLKERGIERRLIPYCASQQIAVVAYTPFGREAFPRENSAGGRVLGEIARRHGKTVRQVILRFLTRTPEVFTIPKAASREHTRENSGGAGWDLPADDAARIDRAFPAPDHDVPLATL
jgi:diketogulonate reductase-like aldo/keto reductase